MVCFNKPVQGEKIESVITQSGCKRTSKKRTDSSCMLTRSGKKVKKKQYEKLENVNTQNDYEATSKKSTYKKKTDFFFVFCKCV